MEITVNIPNLSAYVETLDLDVIAAYVRYFTDVVCELAEEEFLHSTWAACYA